MLFKFLCFRLKVILTSLANSYNPDKCFPEKTRLILKRKKISKITLM